MTMFIAGLVAAFLLIDVVYAILAALQHREAWKGFKPTKNGGVYNIEAKRFATKEERKALFAVLDII